MENGNMPFEIFFVLFVWLFIAIVAYGERKL